jgi:tetratricopeptide (TPR) repeat protein
VALERNRLPKPVDGIDVRALPIGPTDAFILSRIDGNTSEADIASATGLDTEQVRGAISRLLDLGAVDLVEAEMDRRSVRAPMASSGQFALGTAVEEQVLRRDHPGATLYDPSELEEETDLDPSFKREILQLFYQLDALSHYELLGVELFADKRAIRSRFHEFIKIFHPDRYYGKKLGSFKVKLDRVFQRASEAHEILTRAEARAEYDAYLTAEHRIQDLARALRDEKAHQSELERVRARIEAEASVEAAKSSFSSEAPTQPVQRPRMESAHSLRPEPAASSSTPPVSAANPRISISPVDPEARRKALARKLGFSSPPPSEQRATSIPPTPTVGPSAFERAADDLRRRYERRMLDARRRQILEYTDRANEAFRERNFVDAVNALRIAVSLAPEDPGLRQRLADLEAEANRELADRYLEQARYEEREQHWAEAARSYARVISGKPTPQAHERLAACLLAAQGDKRSALEHARKAVLGAPNEVKNRITLARAYQAAGMKESSIGELERASALAPTDDTIKEQLRRARRGEF